MDVSIMKALHFFHTVIETKCCCFVKKKKNREGNLLKVEESPAQKNSFLEDLDRLDVSI